MGLFGKLFGGAKVDIDSLPRKKVFLKDKAVMILSESVVTDKMTAEELSEHMRYLRECPEADTTAEIRLSYEIELEYVIVKESDYKEMLEGQDEQEAFTDAFNYTWEDIRRISIKEIENKPESFVEKLKAKFNDSYDSWGIKCTDLVILSLEPAEEYKEFYEGYKEMWK